MPSFGMLRGDFGAGAVGVVEEVDKVKEVTGTPDFEGACAGEKPNEGALGDDVVAGGKLNEGALGDDVVAGGKLNEGAVGDDAVAGEVEMPGEGYAGIEIPKDGAFDEAFAASSVGEVANASKPAPVGLVKGNRSPRGERSLGVPDGLLDGDGGSVGIRVLSTTCRVRFKNSKVEATLPFSGRTVSAWPGAGGKAKGDRPRFLKPNSRPERWLCRSSCQAKCLGALVSIATRACVRRRR